MTRSFLENLGLEEDAVNKIIAENGKDITSLKVKLDDLNEQLNVKEETLKQKNQKISELEKIDIEEIKKQAKEEGRQ